MNLLMVDDDVLILRDIQQKLDWDLIGFDKVFTAHSATEALSIFRKVPIHVLLCDIEMPGPSGLELIETVRAEKSSVQCLLLTSYARFDYARRAVQLDTMDYLLKPVAYDSLEQTLIAALKRAEEVFRQRQASLYGQYWIDERKNAAEYFWLQMGQGKVSTLYSAAEKLGYRSGRPVIPCVLEAFPSEVLKQWDYPTFEYAVKNITGELLASDAFTLEAITALSQDRWLLVLEPASGPVANMAELEEKAQALLHALETSLSVSFSLAIGMPTPLDGFATALKQVRDMQRNRAQRRGQLLLLHAFQPTQPTYASPAIGLWESLLETGDPHSILPELAQHLNRQAAQNNLSGDTLLAFQQDIIQLVYAYLHAHNIQAHRLFSDAQSEQLYQDAARSCDDMLLYCRHLITRACAYVGYTEEGHTLMERILAYIDSNYQKEVTRTELANVVYISPDYLSRLFKKETGKSLTQYITHKRIDAASELLLSTHLPVNSIAMQVGFSSFAYFSKVFRDMQGMTPMEYRRQRAGE